LYDFITYIYILLYRATFSINWSAPAARYKVNLSTTGWRVEIIWQRPHVDMNVYGRVSITATGTKHTHTHTHTHPPHEFIAPGDSVSFNIYNVETILRRSTCHGKSPDLFAPPYMWALGEKNTLSFSQDILFWLRDQANLVASTYFWWMSTAYQGQFHVLSSLINKKIYIKRKRMQLHY